jgi:hypothetical protein
MEGDRTWSEGDCRCFECGCLNGGGIRQNASWSEWGCVPADTPTLKSVDIREWGFRGRVRFYLGDCSESPIYRGGGLQSRCNGTLGSGGYEIVESVNVREFIAGTCGETLWLVWTGLARSVYPLAEKGCGASNVAKRGVWALDCIGPK